MSPVFSPVPRVSGVAAPLLVDNVDTDAIIPSREIRGVGKTGLTDGLFAGWRYVPGGREPNPDFVLNQRPYPHAPILLAGENFGCGSSREHAVWALHEYGVRAVIAASFAPIFRSNCIANGIIPVVLPRTTIDAVAQTRGPVTIDLSDCSVIAGAIHATFAMDDEPRTMLMRGLDAIDLTLTNADAIAAFHTTDGITRPWIYEMAED